MINTKNINKLLQHYLDTHCFDCVVKLGTDFEYYYNTNTICYSFLVEEENDKLFKEYFYELGLQYDVDIFLLSFFHELGHHMTLDDVEEEDYVYSIDTKDWINEQEPSAELVKMYQRLPDEQMATQWACDYINENANAIKELWKRLQPLILKFYEDNGLTN